MEWSAAQYLKFGDARTQVSRDLARRVAQHLPTPGRIVDLGCGPGNSTAVLAQVWPQAQITGLDASASMLASARAAYPESEFVAGDITDWAQREAGCFDLVFSNSALQWLPHYAELLPRLLARVAPGGALALQVPANWNAAACQIPRELATRAEFQKFFPPGAVTDWHSEDLARIYDQLAPGAARVELWETEYVEVLAGVDGIVEWYKGSGLREYLAALSDEAERERFSAIYLGKLRAAYPAQRDGRVLFPFRRRFAIAWAGTAPGGSA